MSVLRTPLAREQHELLRAHAFRVHVDDDLQPDLVEPAEPEIRHLDPLAFGRAEDDPCVVQHRGRALAGLFGGHSATRLPLVADSWSASSVYACPIASSRPSSNSLSPRIASLTFSSSSR